MTRHELEKAVVAKLSAIVGLRWHMSMLDGRRRRVIDVLVSTPGLERLPFLFVSAFDDTHTREAIKDLRCDGFLRKTTPTPELIARFNDGGVPAASLKSAVRGPWGRARRRAVSPRCLPRAARTETPSSRLPASSARS